MQIPVMIVIVVASLCIDGVTVLKGRVIVDERGKGRKQEIDQNQAGQSAPTARHSHFADERMCTQTRPLLHRQSIPL